MSEASEQRAVFWYPPSYDIRVETAPIPRIQEPDDAIVKITLAGLCGSDLHTYRGHGEDTKPFICGHEFIGQVIALGSSFETDAAGRPSLYSTLRVGDKVVSPFTVSCGECHFCRVGFTCRCVESRLFGTEMTPGGQAQYVRVPRAGGTLYSLSSPDFWGKPKPSPGRSSGVSYTDIADSSLLLLCDILPTGVFAAFQALHHPKVLPMVLTLPYPSSSLFGVTGEVAGVITTPLRPEDAVLTLAIVGLGPVGLCACVSLVDMLAARKVPYRIVAIDLVEARRQKARVMYDTIDRAERGEGEFVVASIEESKGIVEQWTQGVGCNAILEAVGNNSALALAYDLVRPFGHIVSVGVHGEPQMPFTGRQLYNKNVSFDFGRCPVRAMFPLAVDLLVRRQDVFGGVGEPASLIDRIVGFDEAVTSYDLFDKGKVGKVLFDPWK
ncbi:hypothetical protein BOTBODRAFT_29760 [Botryobasidium botryosum FD-172 SS1]|uniref:Uncharacterized protein n=1 Tax=Botryobasidium botryosum (strain FD-172 SS1) TaxID=930990 RepID=A0A067MP96_BOTB1|nr:hypothetical protein BOTBODRAFT_29760 [Botryobasidium botryosum FD-172 SS1]